MKKLKEYFSLSTYLIFHPVDGFFEMKTGKRGKIGIIFINVIFVLAGISFQKQYTGFALNDNNPYSYNILKDFVMVVSVFLLWCVGNWSVTTLMEGEGSFKDISMCTAYSMTPVILIFFPATIISNAMVVNEKEFFTMVLGVAVAWMVLLMFMGILSVHNYTFGKTIVTIILTIIAILIIVFLIGLVFSLVQQVFTFCESVYTEIIYRL